MERREVKSEDGPLLRGGSRVGLGLGGNRESCRSCSGNRVSSWRRLEGLCNNKDAAPGPCCERVRTHKLVPGMLSQGEGGAGDLGPARWRLNRPGWSHLSTPTVFQDNQSGI